MRTVRTVLLGRLARSVLPEQLGQALQEPLALPARMATTVSQGLQGLLGSLARKVQQDPQGPTALPVLRASTEQTEMMGLKGHPVFGA